MSRTASEVGFSTELIDAVESVNNRQKEVLFRKLSEHFGGDLQGKTVALWGLAFKPNTDDMREAPSRTIMDLLLEAGAKVKAYDPVAMVEARRIYGDEPGLVFCEAREETRTDSDAG